MTPRSSVTNPASGAAKARERLEELRAKVKDWKERLIDMNRASESSDYWNEEEYGDQSDFRDILAVLDKPKCKSWNGKTCAKSDRAQKEYEDGNDGL